MTGDQPSSSKSPSKTYGNLLDFVHGARNETELHIDVSLREDGKVVIFHNYPFTSPISWFEFDVTTRKLEFIFNDGESRDMGLPIGHEISKNMQNTHQILTILLDNDTGQVKEDVYVPLIIHQS